ncbi:hypothetical protein K1719_043092 [Acacia pycnantha]|nr:hypothetical protein K1719_043092 [Acacia pycnantha]
MASSISVSLRVNPHFAKTRTNHHLLRQDNGFWGERIKGSLNNNMCVNQSATCLRKGQKMKKAKPRAVSAVLSLTSNNAHESVNWNLPSVLSRRADPKNVASIILGGGPGTHLFPLTQRSATPAVPLGGCYKLIHIPMSNCINSGINKIFVLTQFNSASLNHHITRTYFGNDINFGDGFVEVYAVRQYTWVLEDAKNTNIENVLILAGDHLYRMDYMDLVQSHVDTHADITISCVATDNSRASDYGLVEVDGRGRIIQFSENPKGVDLEEMQVNTFVIGLSPQDVLKSPYIASMGVYVVKTDVLLELLKFRYPSSNDFGSEIIPAAVKEHNVQAFFFRDYWEDIGTIKSFYDANLALTEENPKFKFYDPETPIYTSPQSYHQQRSIIAR